QRRAWCASDTAVAWELPDQEASYMKSCRFVRLHAGYCHCTDNAFPRRGFAVEDFMLRFIACSFATLTLAVAPVALHAQEDERPASDRYTVAGAFGGLSGPDRLTGGGGTTPAGNAGAGVEYRFTRWGLRAEARDYVYQFDRYGYHHTQNQVAWQGGLTLSF